MVGVTVCKYAIPDAICVNYPSNEYLGPDYDRLGALLALIDWLQDCALNTGRLYHCRTIARPWQYYSAIVRCQITG